MSPFLGLWIRDAALSLLGLVVVLAGVVVLVDGVEAARLLGQGVAPMAWLGLVLATAPGRVIALVPVAAVIATAAVAVAWLRSGRLVAASACGLSLRRLAAASAVGAFLVVSSLVGARELVLPRTAAVLAPHATWIMVQGGEAPVLVHADALLGDRVQGLRVARLRGGELVDTVSAEWAAWDGQTWTSAGGDDLGVLPPPERWRDLAVGPGAEAPLASLWVAPASPARTAWLWGRLVDPLLAALLALATPALAVRSSRGLVAVVAAAALFRLTQGGALAAVAAGVWPAWLGLGLPLAVLAPVAIWVWLRC